MDNLTFYQKIKKNKKTKPIDMGLTDQTNINKKGKIILDYCEIS
jgi:hypothetical protein